MKVLLLIVLVSLTFKNSLAVSLLQESQDIYCESSLKTVLIDKKDRFFETEKIRYQQVEFLDSAILGIANSNQSALIQLTTKNSALFIEGQLFNFQEKDCRQYLDSKICKNNQFELQWAPTFVKFNGEHLSVKHYGIYPNDGTFFIAINTHSNALALIDYGSNVTLLFGAAKVLTCHY